MTPIAAATFATRFPGLASALDQGDLDVLLGVLELHDADAGEALVAQDAPTNELFLVWEGRLDVSVSGAAGERRLARIGPGSYFGEVSLFDPGAASANVVTEQGCVVLRLSRERLDELRGSRPEAAAGLLWDVLHSLATRVRAATSENVARNGQGPGGGGGVDA